MRDAARAAEVRIVAGDTKVVRKGDADRIFINTAGVGKMNRPFRQPEGIKQIRPGDLILINGNIGDHGMAVMSARESFRFKTTVVSDCAPLNHLTAKLLDACPEIRFMRDPTRGGVAGVLNEIAGKCGLGIRISETEIPVSKGVSAMCELLGFEPLHIANEGKVIVVAPKEDAGSILSVMKNDPLGAEAAIIGEVTEDHPGKVALHTETGGKRLVDMLTGDPLPRIC